MEPLKHLWELAITGFSILMSYTLYRHKQTQKKNEHLVQSVQKHETMLEVFDQQIESISDDIAEIKADVKTIIYKLLGSDTISVPTRKKRQK